MQPVEELVRNMKNGSSCFGMYVTIPSPAIVEIAAMAGYDFIRIDCEHGLLGKGELRELIRTANLCRVPVFVRVASLDDISAVLDAGADGVIVPDVASREDALEAVRRVKYAPLGSRGLISVQRNMGFGSRKASEYVTCANPRILLCIQIEEKKAVEALDEILSVEGIDMVASGKQDLSQSYGCPGDTTNKQVMEAQSLVIRKALEYGRIPSILTPNPENMKKLSKEGVPCFLLGFDTVMIRQAMERMRKEFQEA